ncbi:MAG: sulfatase-like hydrolase/transferase, partial [Candidatus Aminicenantes bacterium]|nr:sulfatase-like hydrolase/transferase [Candidatus Aminicenantes bacterium]
MRQKYLRNLSVFFVAVMLISSMIININCKKELKDYNIVVIVIDTLRSDKLDAYGYEKITAPFLTELSKKSILFENTFSASSWTTPGTASIFTSLYPFQHNALMGLLAHLNAKKKFPNIKIDRIPDEIETMPEV